MLERNTADPDAKKSVQQPMSIAFGLERIGLNHESRAELRSTQIGMRKQHQDDVTALH